MLPGIEVWFDKSELRGGDAWDQLIRRQIRDCALFVPIISGNSEGSPEGYFRLEWDLADQRSHMIVRHRPFIVPVCLDRTPSRQSQFGAERFDSGSRLCLPLHYLLKRRSCASELLKNPVPRARHMRCISSHARPTL